MPSKLQNQWESQLSKRFPAKLAGQTQEWVNSSNIYHSLECGMVYNLLRLMHSFDALFGME